jgi:5-methylthioadenosine/S-adenosylhomocysteine deaminase
MASNPPAFAKPRSNSENAGQMKVPADLLLLPQWVVPVESEGALVEHGVVVKDGKILDVLPTAAAVARYDCAESLALSGQALIPGLVNLHSQAARSLVRGFADDLPRPALLERLRAAVKPHLSEAFVHDGTLLAAAEMLAGGVTHCSDTYCFPNGAAQAFLEAGMRASVAMLVREAPSAYAADADDYLARGLATRDALKDEALLSFTFHAHRELADANLGRVNALAEQLCVPLTKGVHETLDAVRESESRFGVRPIERLARLGLLGPNFIALHAVHVDAAEIELLARHGCHVAHCPATELQFACGIAPTAAFLRAGVNVGFGGALHGRIDLFAEMRLAALIAKGASGDASALPAAATLKAATLGAATALGLDGQIGSIATGKRADLVAVDLVGPGGAAPFDPVSHLVYVAGREDVTHVWVDGKMKLHDRRLVALDTDDLAARAAYWRGKLTARG